MKCALLLAATCLCLVGLPAEPAGAVDRTLGAEVPKPAIGGAPWSADAKVQVARDVDALLDAAPTLRGAHVGLLAIDTRSGDVIYSRKADDAFVPASTMKLLTGSVALATLGPAYRFRSEAYLAPSNAQSDAGRQTLFLRAGGDPLLSAADIGAMGQAARATGEFHSPFPFRIDASAFDRDPYPPGWSSDDFLYDYAPKLTPAPLDENAMHLSVTPGAKPGDPVGVRESPAGAFDLPPVTCGAPAQSPIAPVATTGQRDSAVTLDVVRDPARGCIEVTGSVPAGAPPQTLDIAVPEPMSRLAQLVAFALARLPAQTPGVARPNTSVPSANTMGGDVLADADASFPIPPGARLVWAHDGEPLTDLIADMWMPSDNLIAEMLLRAIGLQSAGSPGTTEHGAAAERIWLTGIGVDPGRLTIADGSGLSTYDRLTPRALAAILQADWIGPYRDVVLDALPIAGVRGTLEQRLRGTLAERRTFAKTGSVSHARGLAGYLATLHHGALTFAWSLDDWMGTDADLDVLRGRVLARLIGD